MKIKKNTISIVNNSKAKYEKKNWCKFLWQIKKHRIK